MPKVDHQLVHLPPPTNLPHVVSCLKGLNLVQFLLLLNGLNGLNGLGGLKVLSSLNLLSLLGLLCL